MTREEVAALLDGTTPGPLTVSKCQCGHKSCNYHGVSSGRFYEGSGFSKADAALYAAAPDVFRDWLRLHDELARVSEANRELHRRAQKAEGLLERMARFLNTWEAAAKRRKDYWAGKYIAAAARHVRANTGTSGILQWSYYRDQIDRLWEVEKENAKLRAALEAIPEQDAP